MNFREAIETDARDLRALAKRAANASGKGDFPHRRLAKGGNDWLAQERARSVKWTPLRPREAKSNSPLLTVQSDDSVFASGDITKSDTYELKLSTEPGMLP